MKEPKNDHEAKKATFDKTDLAILCAFCVVGGYLWLLLQGYIQGRTGVDAVLGNKEWSHSFYSGWVTCESTNTKFLVGPHWFEWSAKNAAEEVATTVEARITTYITPKFGVTKKKQVKNLTEYSGKWHWEPDALIDHCVELNNGKRN